MPIEISLLDLTIFVIAMAALVCLDWLIRRDEAQRPASRPTLAFDITDAPMLMHAMMIAGNTARMCGHPQAEIRLREFQAYFAGLMPVEASYFDEESWGEIGMALAQAETFKVFLDEDDFDKRARAEGRGRWCKNYQLYVQVADKVFWGRGIRYSLPAHESLKAGDPRVKSVFDLLKSLAPASCIGVMDDQTAQPVT